MINTLFAEYIVEIYDRSIKLQYSLTLSYTYVTFQNNIASVKHNGPNYTRTI